MIFAPTWGAQYQGTKGLCKTISGPLVKAHLAYPLCGNFLPENAFSLQAGIQPWAGCIETQICEERKPLATTSFTSLRASSCNSLKVDDPSVRPPIHSSFSIQLPKPITCCIFEALLRRCQYMYIGKYICHCVSSLSSGSRVQAV